MFLQFLEIVVSSLCQIGSNVQKNSYYQELVRASMVKLMLSKAYQKYMDRIALFNMSLNKFKKENYQSFKP
jgi:hypothetical protein